ncbi:MAG: hypothetical protein OEZ39_15230 [Gammaproteobacteria bacterium]|nr:hypothetical protein [Gammaproteobacteria bacterium]MDH5653207.1 hypothetical protein [Gammaproteobacteria bacterium]
MNVKLFRGVAVALTAFFLTTGFGLGDIGKTVDHGTKDCSKAANKKACEKSNTKKKVFNAAVIGVAAKLIHDMIIEFKSSQVGSDESVVKQYTAKHKSLPKKPTLVTYKSSVKPGQVVTAGKPVLVASDLTVVRGKSTKQVKIEEEFSIYDNEDNKKLLKSLKKVVNDKTKQGGQFQNEFKFTLPVGMPQGVYPLKTTVLVDNKPFKPVANKMQLVLHVDEHQNYQIVALAE